ncbi:actin cytoskeleton-regulatory complex protein PAN1-like [Chenopodium quinoa]|uniref:actin cytoskeleton-regulatory complex protein PAN1-like n=1 Tax=Chenopodium quinoa TaxID=63459 RepID=UPI000B788B24|nr:actin cytoskeleton-regulatory complex protein PAN1-like [Chenopodium quinoa]
MAAQNPGDLFDSYFRRADLDRDGRISGAEAVAFFQGSNLPKQVLAQIWTFADHNRTGFLGRAEFYNALKLVTVAQSKRELTPELVKAALYGPASAKIPAPQISLPPTPGPQSSTAGSTPSAPQTSNVAPISYHNPGPRGVPVSPNVNMNQQYNQPAVSGTVRPQNTVSGVATQPVQGVGFQGFPGGAPQPGSNLPNSRPSNDVGVVNTGRSPTTVYSERSSSLLTNQSGVTSTAGPAASLPPKPSVAAGNSVTQPKPSQNGFTQGSFFGGEALSSAPSLPKREGSVLTSSAGSVQVSSPSVPVAAGNQSFSKQGSVASVPNSLAAHSFGGQHQKLQSHVKQNQQIPVQNFAPRGLPASPPNNSAGHQPQLNWPRPTQTDLQKYTNVFMEVDTDKDGKITGEQARNLFLSWKLPREVLKQVWDLSDQDNDSNLSLREFCIALYLMERYREGRPLPAVLPSSVVLDFPATTQPPAGYGNAGWVYSAGFQQPQAPGTAPRPNARPTGKPPLPVTAHMSSDDRMPPKPPKAKVPTLEKHLVEQLSEEEQKSLNLKFLEASEANKKVEELEKEIKEAREKTEFYRVKMQELVLYKSRCDSRFNEVSERAAADKREVESLAKKYEEKYRQNGDVASRLTIEEATFRDIQEKKMEMYQAIVKMEQDGTDENLQVRADHIQSSLEELIRSLCERCKKYGLRAKPTTLVELPFGWQPGIQESAADWDEDWDKFEDEGYTFVKDLTLDVNNIIAPPKSKIKVAKKEKNMIFEGDAAVHTSDSETKPVKSAAEDEQVAENGVVGTPKAVETVKNTVSSPARSSHGSPRDGSKDNHFQRLGSSVASPRAKESLSDVGVADSSFSGEKSFDEPSQGTFDTNDDADSIWGFSKEMKLDKHNDDLFGHGQWTLPPIRTSSSQADDFLPKKGIFADSVPGTPADVFVPKKSIFADSVPGTPADGFLPKQSIFADSVPSTPLYESSYSPQKFGEGLERGLNFSRFDSFRSSDSGFQPQEKLSRFDSMRSTGDFDSHDDRSFQQRDTFSRFDSMRSNNDFDYGDRSSSFDDSDAFGSGPFKSSFGSETPRGDSDAFGSSAFRSSLGNETPRSEIDAFGSVGPFRSSMANETPRADSDPFGAPFRSSLGVETPRADGDPFGSVGPFKSSWGSETPRADADPFGGPFKSSFGSETPRGESDFFGYSGSFKSPFGSETPRGEFDSYGFGGPFGSSLGSETPRGDMDAFGSSGPFKTTVGSETPKDRTDSWSAF